MTRAKRLRICNSDKLNCVGMAKYIKGNISYLPVVEQINRKFTTKKNTCSNVSYGPTKAQPAKFMGGATLTRTRAGMGAVSKNYMFFRENPRTSPLQAEEINRRQIFAAVRKAIETILEDLSQISRVQTLFLEAKDDSTKRINGVSAMGYTIKGWMFAVQYAGRKNNPSYDVDTFPQGFDS